MFIGFSLAKIVRNYRRKGEKLSDMVEFRLSERDKNKLAYALILSQIGQEANVKPKLIISVIMITTLVFKHLTPKSCFSTYSCVLKQGSGQ